MRSIVLLLPCALLAQAPPRPAAPAAPPSAERKTPLPEEKTSKTEHTVRIGGEEVRYTATAGTINLKKEDGTPTASIFYIAYVKDNVADPAARPIAFTFNGGPGSSSVWLHLGLLGPRRVLMNPEGTPTPPPCRLVDNDSSLLD